ncbi:MAG: hypothetical protein KME32_00885 [Mojavia pulchra JT2-VF2]|jgi:hypothetical protein|uniref:Uncharacterized protein n=1 Tax=Mojavia pulchra JT2-VF2 TaxID=287848 RepID=A0A951PTK3_9NOST|nr:hypothetical protein [Mojavia pulchra JT2-VF2]
MAKDVKAIIYTHIFNHSRRGVCSNQNQQTNQLKISYLAISLFIKAVIASS